MISTFKKIIFALVVIGVFFLLGLIGFNVYINYRTYGFKRDKEEERLKNLKAKEDKEKLDREIAEYQKKALEGFDASGKGTILRAEDVNHLGMLEHPNPELKCLRCHGCEECFQGDECQIMQPRLIFNNKVNEYIFNVLQDINDFRNGEPLKSDGYNDNVSHFLKRRNAALYGAPGTGKTELINELVHHLQERFGDPENKIAPLNKEIKILDKKLDELKKRAALIGNLNPEEVTEEDKRINQKLDQIRKEIDTKKKEVDRLKENYKVPPVIKIDGVALQTGGAAAGQPSPEEKLIKIILHYKKEAFGGNPFSKDPYIVFVEEADQGKNVMTAGKNNLLEEYKNFLSTSEDKIGLKGKAQDENSIIIIATNNFDQIDPAVVRRGRLGEKLNFNWTPALLEKYSKRGDSEWEKVCWPEDDPSWQFTGNVNYEELYKLCSQFGYSKFADQFTCKVKTKMDKPETVNKVNQILQTYRELSRDEEWKKNKEKELGKFPTGKKIMERKQNKKTGEWEEEEVDEKICNWILHFIHTFHIYNNRQDLDSFTSIDQIQAYDFGDAYATREAIWGIYRRIAEEIKVLEVNNDLTSKISEGVHSIKDFMTEVNDVRNQFKEIEHKINELISQQDKDREGLMSNIRVLQSNVERIGSNNSETNELRSRINALESKFSSSSGGGGSSSSSDKNYKDLKSGLDNLIEELRKNIDSSDSKQIALLNQIISFFNRH